jgi:hypothetical protein
LEWYELIHSLDDIREEAVKKAYKLDCQGCAQHGNVEPSDFAQLPHRKAKAKLQGKCKLSFWLWRGKSAISESR